MADRRGYFRNYQRRRRAMNRLGLQVVESSAGKDVAMDSRQVAEIIGKRHDHLIRDIRRYIEVMDASPNLGAGQFFLHESYEDANGQRRPGFLLTKQGCEMVANKMTGEKGILFTAMYVSRFNEMEKIMQRAEQPKTSTDLLEDFEAQVRAAKHTADMLGADREERLAMLAVIHEEHGLSTTYLEVLDRKADAL